jgi:hypothetical protein
MPVLPVSDSRPAHGRRGQGFRRIVGTDWEPKSFISKTATFRSPALDHAHGSSREPWVAVGMFVGFLLAFIVRHARWSSARKASPRPRHGTGSTRPSTGKTSAPR